MELMRTAENVVLLETSCSHWNVRYRHTSQYVNFQGIPAFVARQLTTSF